MKIVFAGAGKMATAIADGVVGRGLFGVDCVAAFDPAGAARTAFAARTGASCAEGPEGLVEDADVLVLAVKPQQAREVIRGLPARPTDCLVISILAGTRLRSIEEWFGSGRLIRVMPNTPLMVGKGASVYACGPAARGADAELTERIFGGLGTVHRVTEDQIDAVTALSGSGPAYVFAMVEAMAAAGAAVGLPAELALQLTVQTVAGAAEMLCQGIGSPAELRTAVTSPGGTTAAGLAVLEEARFGELIRRVVEAARRRAVELGQA